MTKRIRVKLKLPTETATGTGVYGKDGVEYPVGTVLTLPEGQTFEESGLINKADPLDGDVTEAHEPVTNPAAEPEAPTATTGYSVAESESAGWWVITDKDGAQVGPKLRKADADAFSALKPDEQDEYAAQHVEAV